jgi:hypothetical protein
MDIFVTKRLDLKASLLLKASPFLPVTSLLTPGKPLHNVRVFQIKYSERNGMHPNTIRRFTVHNHLLITLAILAFAAFSIGFCVWSPPSVNASATELFFSEYIEGSSNNKALEIF